MKKKKVEIQFFEKPPQGFNPQIFISGCYVEWERSLLLLKRAPKQYAGDLWCLPGGKLEKGEKASMGALRELKEETGLILKPSEIHLIGTIYLRRLPSPFDYAFTIYYHLAGEKPKLIVNPREHVEARWVLFKNALELPLIPAGVAVLKYCSEKISRL